MYQVKTEQQGDKSVCFMNILSPQNIHSCWYLAMLSHALFLWHFTPSELKPITSKQLISFVFTRFLMVTTSLNIPDLNFYDCAFLQLDLQNLLEERYFIDLLPLYSLYISELEHLQFQLFVLLKLLSWNIQIVHDSSSFKLVNQILSFTISFEKKM